MRDMEDQQMDDEYGNCNIMVGLFIDVGDLQDGLGRIKDRVP
jgi:hypothetical protein